MKIKFLVAIIAFMFISCGGNDTSYTPITPVEPEEEYVVVNERCMNCYGYGTVTTMYGPQICNQCGGQGVVSVKKKVNRGNVSFRGEDSDGYIPDGNITLERVSSGIKETFPHYYNGNIDYVKYGSSYIRVSGCGKFVTIGGVDYYAL